MEEDKKEWNRGGPQRGKQVEQVDYGLSRKRKTIVNENADEELLHCVAWEKNSYSKKKQE